MEETSINQNGQKKPEIAEEINETILNKIKSFLDKILSVEFRDLSPLDLKLRKKLDKNQKKDSQKKRQIIKDVIFAIALLLATVL